MEDKIHLVGHSEDFNQTVSSMQIDRQELAEAKKGQEIGLKVDQKVHENATVFKAWNKNHLLNYSWLRLFFL